MQISAPLFVLKRQARLLSRRDNLPLHEALNQIARQEGYDAWSLLARHALHQSPARKVLQMLRPGELILLGARPGQGKTTFGLQLCIAGMQTGRRCHFFSLDYVAQDINALFLQLDEAPERYHDQFVFDDADQINARYIRSKIQQSPAGSIVVVDYLQALELDRSHPPLSEQLPQLKDLACESGAILVFISQIDRRFSEGLETSQMPKLKDVKVVNPFDLSIFDHTCFIHEGQIELNAA
ncbi:MAG: DNA helicase [Pseudomonadota bacterium]